MKLLIVDDQIYVAQGLCFGIDWKAEGFSEVFIALNALEARAILQKNTVDIMLCDIEMPMENGLSLIRWIRGQKMPTRCILLTAHPDFQYAREAIPLDVTDYIVQPAPYAEVLRVVRKAIQECGELVRRQEASPAGEELQKQQELMEGMALQSWLVSQQQAPYREVLGSGAGRLPDFEDEVCLAEICILRWESENSWNSDTLFYAMKNMVDELFAAYECKVALAELAQQDYACIVWGSKTPQAEMAAKQFEYLSSAFRLYFHCEAAIYLQSPVQVCDLPAGWKKLHALHAGNIARRSMVQVYRTQSGSTAGGKVPAGDFDIDEVARMLGQGLSRQVQARLFARLDQLLADGRLDAAVLRGFYQDFMHALYDIAEESGVDPKTLFDTDGAFELYRSATHSVEEMKTFLAYVCSQYEGLAGEEGSRRIVLKAEEYIKHNLEKNIRRDDVAAYAHVSAGYLSHLFSREKGCSLKEYIVRQKMLLARSLLRTTALPISIVAMRVGYTNFSQFSQSYKAAFQCSPSAERKAMEQEPKL